MKQTAVEYLIKEFSNILGKIQTKTLQDSVFLIDAIEKAKEMEKQQQGYNVEDLECAWNSSDQNMRFQFSSSAYKGITFKQWLEKFKQEKDVINR